MSLEGNAIPEYASLSGKIHSLVIDKTLSISGAAADAAEVGKRIEPLEQCVEEAKAEYEKAIEGMNDAAAAAAQKAVDELPVITTEEIKAICV